MLDATVISLIVIKCPKNVITVFRSIYVKQQARRLVTNHFKKKSLSRS